MSRYNAEDMVDHVAVAALIQDQHGRILVFDHIKHKTCTYILISSDDIVHNMPNAEMTYGMLYIYRGLKSWDRAIPGLCETIDRFNDRIRELPHAWHVVYCSAQLQAHLEDKASETQYIQDLHLDYLIEFRSLIG